MTTVRLVMLRDSVYGQLVFTPLTQHPSTSRLLKLTQNPVSLSPLARCCITTEPRCAFSSPVRGAANDVPAGQLLPLEPYVPRLEERCQTYGAFAARQAAKCFSVQSATRHLPLRLSSRRAQRMRFEFGSEEDTLRGSPMDQDQMLL